MPVVALNWLELPVLLLLLACQVTCKRYAPTCSRGKFPSQRPGAVGCSVMACCDRSGATILACTCCWPEVFTEVPEGRSTVTCQLPLAISPLSTSWRLGVGKA